MLRRCRSHSGVSFGNTRLHGEQSAEATYGDRDHESVDGAKARLAQVVRDTAARGGRILIPAFAVGRTQEIIYNLHSLIRESAIPAIPIYIDSPLAIDTTTVFEMHPEAFDQSED